MFYEQLNKLCKEKKITVSSLLAKLDMKKSNGTSWKKGGSPSVEVLIKISKELDTSIDFLLIGEYNVETQNKIELLELFKNLSEDKQEQVIEYTKFIMKNDKNKNNK